MMTACLRRGIRWSWSLVLCACFASIASGADAADPASPRSRVLKGLAGEMDRFHTTLDVYTDAWAGGNHFVCRARMTSPGDEALLPQMVENCTTSPHRGATCIEARFLPRGLNWGGWYLMNGVLGASDSAPRPNWGTVPESGLDLRGAKCLRFWARGKAGGEIVEFYALGVGRNPYGGWAIERHPGSSPKATTGFVTLTKQWKQYEIPLGGRKLNYVLGGFGWSTNALKNRGRREVTFFLDDIQYHYGEQNPRLAQPRFICSYRTGTSDDDFDRVLRNVAFTYDNALALLALCACKEYDRAKLLADAMVYAQNHDRFFRDGRLRNAYQAGDLAVPPGWTPQGRKGTVRLPGWYDSATGKWTEDSDQVGTSTGNVAWAMIALLTYYEARGGEPYLEAAKKLGQWVEKNCRDTRGAGGYTAGVLGWADKQQVLRYKATEHNIDLVAGFGRLGRLTQDPAWRERADHARKFVDAMWDAKEGKFWTGTGTDGATISKTNVPLDIQAWAVLAMPNNAAYARALDWADNHCAVGDGFDFNNDRDGIWYEGTAHVALARSVAGQPDRAARHLRAIEKAIDENGAIPATSTATLTTGFQLPSGKAWMYHRRPHIAASAWYLLAHTKANPLAPTAPGKGPAGR